MSSLSQNLVSYDNATQDTTTNSIQFSSALAANPGGSGQFFGQSSETVVSERPDNQRVPITAKVMLRPIHRNMQQTYESGDMFFVMNPRKGFSSNTYDVYNLQWLNEVLQEKVHSKFNQRDDSAQLLAQMRGAKRYQGLGGSPAYLEDVPATVEEFRASVFWMGVAGADLQDNVNRDSNPYTGLYHQAFSYDCKNYTELPQVFMNADGEPGMPIGGCQLGLWVGRVSRDFYSQYYHYSPHESDEERTQSEFLQVIPVWRRSGHIRAMPADQSREQQTKQVLSIDYRVTDQVLKLHADNTQNLGNPWRELPATTAVDTIRLYDKTSGKGATLEHGHYLWIGTAISVQGREPSPLEQKQAIRSRIHWNQLKKHSRVQLHLNGTVGMPLPLPGF